MTKISDLLHQHAKTPHNDWFGACQNLGCSEGTLGDAERQFRTEEIHGVGTRYRIFLENRQLV